MQKINPILSADSYKFSQWPELYVDGATAMYGYIEPRIKQKQICAMGITPFVKDYLTTPITKEDIEEAEYLVNSHGEPFNRKMWDRILNVYGGFMPMTVRGVAEGTVLDSSKAIVSVMSRDPETMTIGSHFETAMQRSVWYMSTIATQGLAMYQNMLYFYEKHSDNPDNIGFSMNDFGQRGATSYESAMLGGLGHLVYFKGTDNVAALRGARYYYGADIAGWSVPASEHSLQVSFGKDNQAAYMKKMLDTYAKPGAIVSIVLDGFDVYRESQLLCTEFKQQIIDSGAKVVFRPDSGDMFEVVPKLLAIQEAAFGVKVNSKGKKVINNVGIIQGDGINPTTAMMLMQRVIDLGYAPECVVMGSGGGLLQSVTRDTDKYAQKTSAMLVNGNWVDTVKDPITDPGKKSKGGIQDSIDFVTYYENGSRYYKPTWDEIVNRAKSKSVV
jgi:nicotinamide phosphoribosyltransferase